MEKIPILLGGIDLEAVVDEDVNMPGEVTDKPIEKGQDVSDHYKPNPTTISLQGSVVGTEAPNKLSKLRKYRNDAELITYAGRNIFNDMLIVNLNTRHIADNKQGFHFDILLQQPKLSKPKTFEIKVANPVTKIPDNKTSAKVKSVTNKGKQQADNKAAANRQIEKLGIYQGGLTNQEKPSTNADLNRIKNLYSSKELGMYQGGLF